MNVEQCMRQAYLHAADSPDRSNQNGAVIIADDGEVVGDCNRFPPNIIVTDDLVQNRDRKLKYIEHAERNAVYAAAANGICTNDQIMVCPWAACHECARAIIMSGISLLFVHQSRMNTTPERWKADVDGALQLMEHEGIKIVYFDAPVRGAPNIIVNGELWSPESEEFVT